MKNYNPFKMWGSYVLPILLIMDYLTQSITHGVFCPKLDFVITEAGELFCEGHIVHISSILSLGIMLPTFQYYIFAIIVGFIFGWGIHSLVRFLRK